MKEGQTKQQTHIGSTPPAPASDHDESDSGENTQMMKNRSTLACLDAIAYELHKF